MSQNQPIGVRTVPGRWPVTLLAALGAVAPLVLQASGAVQALALATLAGVGLSLALRGAARRVLGSVVALLGAALAVAGWPDIAFVLSGVVAALAGLLMALVSGRWTQRAPAFERQSAGDATPRDMWLAMDAGDDPTEGETSGTLRVETPSERSPDEQQR